MKYCISFSSEPVCKNEIPKKDDLADCDNDRVKAVCYFQLLPKS